MNMISDNRTLRDKYRSATHEAGHAAVALALGIGIDSIDIKNADGRWGETRYCEEDVLHDASDLDLLTSKVAGVVAERRYYLDNAIPLDGTDKRAVDNLLKRYSPQEGRRLLQRAYERADEALAKNKGIYMSLKTCLNNYGEVNRHDLRRTLKFNILTRIQ